MSLYFRKNSLFKRLLSQMSKKKQDKVLLKNTTKETEASPITLDKLNNIIISISAKPGAKQNAITDITPEGVGVQINAPPIEGEANTEVVKYMASVLGIRKSEVVFERGFKSRRKTLKITANITIEHVKNKLLEEISRN